MTGMLVGKLRGIFSRHSQIFHGFLGHKVVVGYCIWLFWRTGSLGNGHLPESFSALHGGLEEDHAH